VPRRFRGFLFLVVPVLVSVFSVGTALAAPSWLSPNNLSGKNSSNEVLGTSRPQVGMAANGEVISGWRANAPVGGELAQVKERPRGGPWSPVQTLESPGPIAPDLAVSAGGKAVMVWEYDAEETDIRGSFIQAAVRGPGGWSINDFFKGEDSSDENPQVSYFPRVAVNDNGEALAVWQQCYLSDNLKCFEGKGEYVARAAIFDPTSGEWGPPKEISAGHTESTIKLSPAIDSQGDMAVAWEDDKGKAVHIRFRRAGQGWSSPQALTTTNSAAPAGSPQVAFAGDGSPIVVWDAEKGGLWTFASAAAPGSTTVPPGQAISEDGINAFQPVLAVAPDGDAVAAWEPIGSGPVQAAVRSNGQWLAPQNLSPDGVDAGHPQVAINSAGTAAVAWEAGSGSSRMIQASTRAAGGSWSGATSLSGSAADGSEPDVAIDSEGNAIAVWKASGEGGLAQAAGFDAAGPRLDGVSIPATAAPGQSLAFGVAPSDAWSALAGTSWSFGDGSNAAGTSVSHAFAQSGTYQVTVTSTDSLGNSSSAAGTVVVSDASTAGTPPGNETTPPAEPKPTGKKSKQGAASGPATAAVRNGKALVTLRCGSKPCSGVAKLVYGQGSVIGRSAFSIPAGGSRTLRIALGPAAMRQLSATDDQQLTVRLEGRGVKSRKLVLAL
jgi:hypothetical protein